jgi:hypothetical protein
LVTVDSFEGDWTINPGPDDGTDMTSGVIPEDQRDMLPTVELCDAAGPEVGEARFGVLTTIEEAGGWAEWRLHNAFVLADDVMMSFLVVDKRAGDGVEPYYSTDDIDEMIEIAADSM